MLYFSPTLTKQKLSSPGGTLSLVVSLPISSISKGLPLFIECPLVLHPCPEVRNTPNLLAVEVGNRIRHRLAGGVDTMLLYPGKKVLFFLQNMRISLL